MDLTAAEARERLRAAIGEGGTDADAALRIAALALTAAAITLADGRDRQSLHGADMLCRMHSAITALRLARP